MQEVISRVTLRAPQNPDPDTMSNLQDLLTQKAALEAQIASLQSLARIDGIAQVKALMTEHGLTIADLSEHAPTGFRKAGASKVAPKYIHPATGQTWSGRGLMPKWLKASMSANQSLNDFAIGSSDNT